MQIRVLLWDPPKLVYPNHARLHDEAVRALNRIPNCHAQEDDAGLTKSHHQKLLVVKGRDGLVALCGARCSVVIVHLVRPRVAAAKRPPSEAFITNGGNVRPWELVNLCTGNPAVSCGNPQRRADSCACREGVLIRPMGQ